MVGQDSRERRPVLPGDSLAVIEEFESDTGTFRDGEVVRASLVGEPIYDLRERKVRLAASRQTRNLPHPGDRIIGVVETSQPSVANVRIHVINGIPTESDFTGMLLSRNDREEGSEPRERGRAGRGRRNSRRPVRSRRSVVCKPGDLIRASVISDKNAIIHLGWAAPDDGVLSTSCSQCGGSTVRLGDAVKCTECSFVEERWLAPDFGQPSLSGG